MEPTKNSRAKNLLKHYFSELGLDVNDGGVEHEIEEIVDCICEAAREEGAPTPTQSADFGGNLQTIGNHVYLKIGGAGAVINLSNVTDIHWDWGTAKGSNRKIGIKTTNNETLTIDYESASGKALRDLFNHEDA